MRATRTLNWSVDDGSSDRPLRPGWRVGSKSIVAGGRRLASRSWAREHQSRWPNAIALIVRQKLRAGRLPVFFRLVRIFSGSDAGARCAACNGDLRTTQLVLEVPLTHVGPLLRLHSDCFMIWAKARAAMWPTAS